MVFDFLFKKKNQQQKEELVAQQNKVKQQQAAVAEKSKQLEKGTQKVVDSNEKLVELQKENTQISKSLDSKAEQIVGLVQRYDDKEQLLSVREKEVIKQEQLLREKHDDIEERQKKIRQDEIEITARKSEVRRKEGEVANRDKLLDTERKDIKEREADAKKLANDAKASKEDVKAKKEKLQKEKEQLDSDFAELVARESTVQSLEKEVADKYQKSEEREKVILAKEEAIKETQESLEKKIAEYDAKFKEIEVYKNTIDGIKFDNTEEGKSAKITVQEAIRKAIKGLNDQAQEFKILEEKYCEGTFKGFSVSIAQIDIKYKKLCDYFEQIEGYVEEHPIMNSLEEQIRLNLSEAYKFKKSHDFQESYEHICRGLEAVECYQILLQFINDHAEGAGEEADEAVEENADEEEPDYYEILDIPEDADEKAIKKACRKALTKWHPDKWAKNSDEEQQEEAHKMTQLINGAKEVLLDKKKRAEYDKRRNSRNQSSQPE